MMAITKSHLTNPPDGGPRARLLPHVMCTLVAAFFLVSSPCAQERPAFNKVTTWFGGQGANKHAFSNTVDDHFYQLDNRYSRLYGGGVFWATEIVFQ
jgi:hypothetical protein